MARQYDFQSPLPRCKYTGDLFEQQEDVMYRDMVARVKTALGVLEADAVTMRSIANTVAGYSGGYRADYVERCKRDADRIERSVAHMRAALSTLQEDA